MRVPLDAGDRTLLIVSGILLVVVSLAGFWLTPRAGTPSIGFPSSYSAAADGAKAAYVLLEEMGYKAERWTKPPTQLPLGARNTILVLAEPFYAASPEEKESLRQFLDHGGRVLATGAAGNSLVPFAQGINVRHPAFDWTVYPALLPGPLTRRAPTIALRGDARWQTGTFEGLVDYGDDRGGAVVSYRVGAGTVIWWADASPLTNEGLPRASNLRFFLNSIGANRETRVLWDEYYHGQRPGLWAYLDRTPLPWGLLQAALLALAVILTYSRRSGPVRALARESRLSPLEFVETVGGLYARKRAAAGALEIAYHRFRSLLARRLGLPAEPGLATIQRLLQERLGWVEPELVPTLRQCEALLQAENPGEPQALRLVQELHDTTRRLRLAGKGD